ncbi:MAG: hypothetical protein IT439_00950 [Phycisphaerales bacterium]|nr:hypothetical protein [Phycisphaerales bacterium]
MTKRSLAWVCAVAACAAVGMTAAVQPALQPEVSGPAPETAPPEVEPSLPEELSNLRVPELGARLAGLDPASPEAYFALAEDVAAVGYEPAHVELAKTLFVLAYSLDRQRVPATWISPSACVALAHLSRLDRERRWLLSLARALDRRYAPPDWNTADPVRVSDETAYAACTAVSLVRAGEGRKARDLLARPEVRALLDAYESLLHPAGLPGEAQRIVREAERWPCPECSNQRIVRKAGTNPPAYNICPWCLGNPGMKLTQAELIGQLRFESRLLAGVHRSWSAQISADGGLPLRDADPGELATTLGIDAERVLWREGRWVGDGVPKPPAREPPTPSPKPAEAPAPGAGSTVSGS